MSGSADVPRVNELLFVEADPLASHVFPLQCSVEVRVVDLGDPRGAPAVVDHEVTPFPRTLDNNFVQVRRKRVQEQQAVIG